MPELPKKRVQWVEKNEVTGLEEIRDVDVYTSADSVTFKDGQTLEQKFSKLKEYATKEDLKKHTSNTNNPHKTTSSKINSTSKDEFSKFEKDISNHSTIISPNTGYTEVGEWADGNPDGENRLGYFVCIDKSDDGITMKKANSRSDVRGVTIINPAFGANATPDKFDDEGKLLSKYNYVTFIGFAIVIDDGRCAINKRCVSDDDGKAIPSNNTMGYQVIERIDDSRILIIVEPNADMLNRVKSNIDDLENKTTISDGSYNYRLGKDEDGIFLQVTDIL